MSIKRKQLYIDASVQGSIILRIISYWTFCIFFLTIPVVIGKTLTEPEHLFGYHLLNAAQSYWPFYATLLAILPFAIFDFLKLSNRFVGPVYRIHASLKDFNESGKYHPIQLRKDDFWQEVVDELNITLGDSAPENGRASASLNEAEGELVSN